jgi:hypothetical protein
MIIINSEENRQTTIDKIRWLELKDNYFVDIRKHKAKRTNQQNKTYWARINDISEQVYIDGRRYSQDVWHEHCKREFLPEVSNSGCEKWSYLPNGGRYLTMGTGDLDTKEFYDYRLQVEACGSNLGVKFLTYERI